MSHASTYPMASEPGVEGGAPILELDHVVKRFGGLSAVDDLSFAVRSGEVLGVIGPNGAGKSTVVGLVAGALSPTSGVIRFEGQDIGRLRPHQRAHLGIARTFQVAQPFAGLSMRENVVVGALFGGRAPNRAAAMRIADEVLERTGLTAKAALKGDELTVADRKRLEMARALALKPRLLLLDEVMAGLIPTEVELAVRLIREINESGVTVVVIEHIMRAIQGVSDRVLVINFGKRLTEGSPQEVLSDPKVIEAYLGERYAKNSRAQGAAPLDPTSAAAPHEEENNS
ncbi:MAG TPA: ABC transporter ATP-binding protein [Ktedonobacterales bacterium]|nr:ABC transporter ATP-binding protein [Ktedonobacterales bacterium]